MNIYLEIFGYIGSAFVLLSMTMTSLVKLRLLNITGSLITVIYASLIGSWPVVFMNAGLILINTAQILRTKKTSAL